MREFSMSMYANKEDLYKAKAEYYEALNKWVSVNDALPNEGEWVLITADSECRKGKRVTMAFHEFNECDDGNEHFWLCHNDAKSISEWEGVTHWMPLPALAEAN